MPILAILFSLCCLSTVAFATDRDAHWEEPSVEAQEEMTAESYDECIDEGPLDLDSLQGIMDECNERFPDPNHYLDPSLSLIHI